MLRHWIATVRARLAAWLLPEPEDLFPLASTDTAIPALLEKVKELRPAAMNPIIDRLAKSESYTTLKTHMKDCITCHSAMHCMTSLIDSDQMRESAGMFCETGRPLFVQVLDFAHAEIDKYHEKVGFEQPAALAFGKMSEGLPVITFECGECHTTFDHTLDEEELITKLNAAKQRGDKVGVLKMSISPECPKCQSHQLELKKMGSAKPNFHLGGAAKSSPFFPKNPPPSMNN